MPGGFPAGFDLCNASANGAVTSGTTGGTAVDPSATADTKSAYVQLIAATGSDCCWIDVISSIYSSPTTGTVFSCDIAIGAGGSEKIIIADLVLGGPTNIVRMNHAHFPICIPAGTRIAARTQASAASETGYNVSVEIFDGGFTQIEGCAGVDTIGFNSGTSVGTLIAPSGITPNTKGSYAQLTASTARDYIGFSFALDNQARNGGTQAGITLDIAVGAAASETIIVPDLALGMDNLDMFPGHAGPFWINIPAGTRISARAQANTVDASRTFGLTLYGIYQ